MFAQKQCPEKEMVMVSLNQNVTVTAAASKKQSQVLKGSGWETVHEDIRGIVLYVSKFRLSSCFHPFYFVRHLTVLSFLTLVRLPI